MHRAARIPWMLPRRARPNDPHARYADPTPLAVLRRRLAVRIRTSADALARRGTLSIVGFGFGAAAVWVAWGLAAGLGAIAVALLLIDWRIPE